MDRQNHGFGTTTTSPYNSTTTTTSVSNEKAAAQDLSTLLGESVADRSAIVNASQAVESCSPTLANDVETFSNAATSRQNLIKELSSIPDASSLPSGLTQLITSAWQASEEVDRDYATWAQQESTTGCQPNNTTNAAFQAATAPNTQATQFKQEFVNQWNPIATQFNLPTYQWDQL